MKLTTITFLVFLYFGNNAYSQNIGKEISPNLFGVFFEDINYAADGGLYAELIQNRSFEYSSSDIDHWQGEILTCSGKYKP